MQISNHVLAVFEWVLKTSAKVGVFIVFLLLVKYVLRNKLSARWHYRLWFIVILALVIPWTPQSRLSVFNFLGHSSLQNASFGENLVNQIPRLNTWFSNTYTIERSTLIVDAKENLNSTVSVPVARINQSEKNTPQLLTVLLLVVWITGAVLMFFSAISVNYIFAQKIKATAINIEDEHILLSLNQAKTKLKVKRQIPLVETSRITSPSLFGVFRPMLLLPIGLVDALSMGQLKYVFVHELSHLRRKDILVNWLTRGLLSIHWFNPLIWYAFFRMRIEQEMACDAVSLSVIGKSEVKEYASTLITILEKRSNSVTVAGLANFFGSGSNIRRRIKMINIFGKSALRWSILCLVIVFLLAGALFTKAIATNSNNLSSYRSDVYHMYLSFKSDVYNMVYGLPNYHIAVNQNDIKEIRIATIGKEKVISATQGATLVREFNNAKITRVRNLDITGDTSVLIALKDGSSIYLFINENEIRVTRHIGVKKVDYILENPNMKTTVIDLILNNAI